MRTLNYDIGDVLKLRNPEFVFFWGHHQKTPGVMDKSCFSQWFPSDFKDEQTDVQYHWAEQYMMAEKARLFSDQKVLDKILAAESPKQCKTLGRKVKGFRQVEWEQEMLRIVVNGNALKFEQNRAMADVLLATGDKIIVEASPSDTVWGVGMSAQEADIRDPNKWRGSNYLGFCLMTVRDILRRKHPDWSPGV